MLVSLEGDWVGGRGGEGEDTCRTVGEKKAERRKKTEKVFSRQASALSVPS